MCERRYIYRETKVAQYGEELVSLQLWTSGVLGQEVCKILVGGYAGNRDIASLDVIVNKGMLDG